MADDSKAHAVALLVKLLDQAAPIPDFHKRQDRTVEASMLIEYLIEAAVERSKTSRKG